MLDDLVGVRITFVEWMALAAPISILLMLMAFVYLNRIGRSGVSEIAGAAAIVTERKQALGPWTRGQRNAVIAFGVTVCLWIGPGLLALIIGRRPSAGAVRAGKHAGGGGCPHGRHPALPAAGQPRAAYDHHVEAGGADSTGARSCCSAAACRSVRCRRPPDWRWR